MMKLIFLFLSILVASFAIRDIDLFNQFITKKGVKYASTAEFNRRFQIFKQNLNTINALNAKGTTTRYGVNEFADLTTEEFRSRLSKVNMGVRDPSWPMAVEYSQEDVDALPDSFDWRAKGAVTGVKNQGDCGSCWSFSATGNMEGQWFLKGNTLVGLSEQNLVDCDHHCMEYQGESVCDAGCDGGLMPNAFAYVVGNGGIDSENSYPYLGEDSTCAFNKSNVVATISNWTMIPGNETQMAAYLVEHGPISIAVDAVSWQFYVGGVWQDPWCGTQLDHGVLIVGFDWEYNIIGEYTQYWIVKNSWGDFWGEDGYIYLERGSDSCGDNLFPCSSIA